MCLDAVNSCDKMFHREMLNSMLLCGGTTLIKGFPNRLANEMKLAVKDSDVSLEAPQERQYSTWIGGSLLGSLSTFD